VSSPRIDPLSGNLYHQRHTRDAHALGTREEPPLMKAEQRKEIETNSMVLLVQRWRKYANSRTLYYVAGAIILIAAGIILYRYFASTSEKARDAVLAELANANTPEKLKQGMEHHRGTVYGSLFKLHLARHKLKNEGLPKLGTENNEDRRQAANAIEEARNYFLELSTELQEKEQPGLVQEAWLSAAHAEEALVGLPVAEGTGYRGDVDKAIEYYQKAGAIFADTDFSKRYAERAETLKANKDQFVATQKEIYRPIERPPPPPLPPPPLGKSDVPGPGLPPPTDPKAGKTPEPAIPPGPTDSKKTEPKPKDSPKLELPPIPSPPDSKKTEPKPAVPPKPDPKPKQ
jgi:hypothetical protein